MRGPAPPLLHQGSILDAIRLPRPEPDAPDPGFFNCLSNGVRIAALASRRSSWAIGHFFGHPSHSKDCTPAHAYEAASRPVACGGAMQEIDTYLVIQRCDGVATGCIATPQAHQFRRLDALNSACEQLLQNACRSSGAEQPPDVLFQFAARYGRLSWKMRDSFMAATWLPRH